MAFPVAAAIVYGMIAGGGLAGSAAAMTRLWGYFSGSREDQDLEDEKMTPVLMAIVEALARTKFGKNFSELSSREQNSLRSEAKPLAPQFKKDINEASKKQFGKTFSRLNNAQKEEVLAGLQSEHLSQFSDT